MAPGFKIVSIFAKTLFLMSSLSTTTSIIQSTSLNRPKSSSRLPIVIQSDADSPVQSLVTAMDVVSQLGLTQVSIATTRPLE